jgi:hypothetical protein
MTNGEYGLAKERCGGGVWESNPTCRSYRYGTTVLKTAPVTGQDAPPQRQATGKERGF